MPQHNEASVEEILESIKKVIARDNRDAALQREQHLIAATADRVEDEDEVLDLEEMQLADDDGEDDDTQAPLTSETMRESMRENFAALAMLAEPGVPPQIVRSGETSLEGLVRDLLRPMLAEWLDKNLPGMVEKMVQAEIARIAGKGR